MRVVVPKEILHAEKRVAAIATGIVAKLAGAHDHDILEIDGATNTGIEDMRSVMDRMRFRGLRKDGVRVCIVDECHALSKQAIQALHPPAK